MARPSHCTHRRRGAEGRPRTPPAPSATALPEVTAVPAIGRHSPAAALLYQHAADDRDADIAQALDAMLSAITEPPDDTERPE
jgi:hypothetical protein